MLLLLLHCSQTQKLKFFLLLNKSCVKNINVYEDINLIVLDTAEIIYILHDITMTETHA